MRLPQKTEIIYLKGEAYLSIILYKILIQESCLLSTTKLLNLNAKFKL